MPAHDWTRVDAGTFHAFHTRWISETMGALNEGLLPEGYYALAEQVATRMQTDIRALHGPLAGSLSQIGPRSGGVAVSKVPPQARLNVRPDPRCKPRRPRRHSRHLVVRHISGHQIVALVEIVFPSNKDRKAHVRDLAEKVVRSLKAGVHVLVIDLLPPGPHDPHGLHGAVWSYFDTTPYEAPTDSPLPLVSYAWDGTEPAAYIEPVAVGRPLLGMPLFLTAERYVNVPLETTYTTAYRGMPEFLRQVLEEGLPGSEAMPP